MGSKTVLIKGKEEKERERSERKFLASISKILSDITWEINWSEVSSIFDFSAEANENYRFLKSHTFHDNDYPSCLLEFLRSAYSVSPDDTVSMVKYVIDQVKRAGKLQESEIDRYPGLRVFLDKKEDKGATTSIALNPFTSVTAESAGDKISVFVVYGRNIQIRDAMFQFLRSIGLKPIEWSQAVIATGKASPYIGEVLDKAFNMAQAIIVVMTPDDEGRLVEKFRSSGDPSYEKELTPQSRLNVIFEAGIAMGRNQDRTVIVEFGRLRPFSDIGGRHVIRMDDSGPRRQELAQRLQTAGCKVDLTGTDWHTCGNFKIE